MVRKHGTPSIQSRIRPLFPRGLSSRSMGSTEPRKEDTLKQEALVKRSNKPPKTVRFADETRELPSDTELTAQERNAYYCTEDDLYKFDRDRALTALSYRKKREIGVQWDESKDKDTLWGLEEIYCRENKADVRRRQTMKVLTAQKQERLAGRPPAPEVLAEVSAKGSKECRHRAVSLGRDYSKAAGTRRRSMSLGHHSSPVVTAAKKVKKQLHLWRTNSPPL